MRRFIRPTEPTRPAARRRAPERLTVAAAPIVAAVLLVHLVQTCETSVRRGEQLRAEQRAGAAAAAVR